MEEVEEKNKRHPTPQKKSKQNQRHINKHRSKKQIISKNELSGFYRMQNTKMNQNEYTKQYRIYGNVVTKTLFETNRKTPKDSTKKEQ
mmetsp:Transcript_5884/g.9807  ORF Transcript_5884/g.9807 Transcript_5884/m.9807 type:complete len:88 (+) Transcript_5884:112-375(+)